VSFTAPFIGYSGCHWWRY